MIYFPFPSLWTLNKFLSKKPSCWFVVLSVHVALATLGNSFTRYPWNVLLLDGFEPPTFWLPGERANHLRHESSSSTTLLIQCVDVSYRIFVLLKTPTVGFEPTTFGLEVQRASPLRHAGMRIFQNIINDKWPKKKLMKDVILCSKRRRRWPYIVLQQRRYKLWRRYKPKNKFQITRG